MDRQHVIRAHYDAQYKRMFAHPEVVRDLLVGFVRGVGEALDPDSLAPALRNLVSESGISRHTDTVGVVRLHGRPLYVPIELQSRDDRSMALRMDVYVGLLLQALQKESGRRKRRRRKKSKWGKKVKQDKRPRKEELPCVLPIVVFIGTGHWTASSELTSLLAPPPAAWLQPLQPMQQYWLVNPSADNLDIPGNFAAALFRLALARNLADVERVLLDLKEPLADPELAWLQYDFILFVHWKLRTGLPSTTIPSRAVSWRS